MPVNNLIQLRKGDTSAWDTDPVLASGEPGFDIEKNILKIGDGSTAWSSLEPVNTALTNFNIYGTGNINISGNITANTGNFDVVSFNTNNESILTKGQISWDDTEGTMDIGLTDNTTIHIGSHRYFRIRNETGGTLYKGQVVYASGVHTNGIIEPALYVADGTIREVRFMGMILEDVNHQNNGYAIDFGHLEEMDLDGSATNYAVGDETWSAGDILYVHPTGAGKLTKNEPKHSISVAIVLDPGNGNGNGRMFVRPTSYGHLDDNHDVAVSGATNGQFLQYNSATDYWVPSSSGNFTTLLVNGTPVPTGVGTSNYVTKWTGANSLGSGIIYDNGTNVGIGTSSPTEKLDVNGSIKTRTGGVGHEDNGCYIAYPGGGTLSNGGNPQSGYLKITLPVSWTSTMLQFEFDLYEYSTGLLKKFRIAGYNFVAGSYWANVSAMVDSDNDFTQYRVHFGHDGTYCAIYISKISSSNVDLGASSTWLYPHGSISNFFGGWSNMTMANWADGWSIGFTTTLGTISATREPSRSYKQYDTSYVFNEYGGNVDFRVEGDTDANLLFTDASTDRVGIGTATPSAKLNVENGNVIFNDLGGNYDFRVEGDTDTNLLFTDASTDRVGIGTASPSSKLHVVGNATFDASSGVPVTITNIGTGNSFVVNDAAGDTTPFTINAAGWVGVGVPVPLAPLNVISANSSTAQELQRWAYFANNDLFNLRLTQTVTQGVVRWTWNQTNNSTDYPNILCFDRGNVGINTTSPASHLDVNGVITVAAGTAAAPALVASGDPNTGAFFPAGGDRFAISTDGLERLRINNLGNVGIGTNSPASRLDVNGVITVSATAGSAGSYLPSLTISGDTNTGFGQVSGQSDSASVFTAGHERVRVDANGNVGIGTASPNGKLDVVGGRTFLAANNEPYSLGVRYVDTGGAVYFGAASSSVTPDAVISNAGGSELIRFATSGNVGIGTSSPAYKLDVAGSGHFDALNINGAFTFPTSDGSANQYLKTDGAGNVSWASVAGGGSTIDGSGVSNYITKWTDSDTLTSGIIYDNGTNVGIGTASPSVKLDVNGNAKITASSGVPLTITNTGTANSFVVEDAAGDTSPFVINADGNIIAGGNSRNIGVSSRLAVSAENANWGVAFQAVCDSVGRGVNIVSADYARNPDAGSLLYFNAASGGFTIGCSSPGDSALGSLNLLVSNLEINGAVGIGTASPSYKLDVVGTGNFSQNLLVNGTGVSLNGHIHTISIGTGDVSQLSFNTDQVLNIVGSGGVNISFNDATNTLTISPPTAVTGYEELTSSKDTFSVSPNYRIGTLSVYYNGFRLIGGRDFTATNGTSFVLAETGSVGDVVEWVGTT